jgi:hypothetical protein
VRTVCPEVGQSLLDQPLVDVDMHQPHLGLGKPPQGVAEHPRALEQTLRRHSRRSDRLEALDQLEVDLQEALSPPTEGGAKSSQHLGVDVETLCSLLQRELLPPWIQVLTQERSSSPFASPSATSFAL